MKGLQRKCLVASAFFHGGLVLLVFVGSAFVSKQAVVEIPAFELIEIPKHLVDEPNVLGGGNPNVTTTRLPPVEPLRPAPQPPAPAPEAKPQEVRPEPKPEIKPVETKPEPKAREPDPKSFDLTKVVKKTVEPKPEKPATTFEFGKAEKKVIKPVRDSKAAESAETSRANNQKLASARSSAIGAALDRVRDGLSDVGGSYEVPGPGGNSMSYKIALQKRYRDAWVGAPTAGRRGVIIEIEIARDGTVLSARIVKKSGNAEYDRSAQTTINRVKRVDPFPEGAKESKRTYTFEITPNELDRG